MATDGELLQLEEVAKLARVSVSSVRHWIKTGRLASIRPGRRRLVWRDELTRFLAQPARATGGLRGPDTRLSARGARDTDLILREDDKA